jgi:hypothetical protein
MFDKNNGITEVALYKNEETYKCEKMSTYIFIWKAYTNNMQKVTKKLTFYSYTGSNICQMCQEFGWQGVNTSDAFLLTAVASGRDYDMNVS